MNASYFVEDEDSDKNSEQLDQLIADLSIDPSYEQIVSEIGVLRSIYGEDGKDAIRVWKPNRKGNNGDGGNHADDKAVRYEVHLGLPPPHDSSDTRFKILVSLPRTYPSSSPPQFQLLSRYIGPYSVDADLFGAVLRTFISSRGGVEWLPGTECVFDGLENVRERVAAWYSEHLSGEKAQELVREDEKKVANEGKEPKDNRESRITQSTLKEADPKAPLPEGLVLAVSEPIVDRKSVFVGRACRISDPSQVPVVLSHLMADRRIARAAHPIINAWRCKVNGVIHQDNDDDGETAAGNRLAHLLQILDVDDVLVIVTRYFGGIHLGPDRFKHINQAARNALELGGFLDAPEERKNSSRLKKKDK